jgi:hypothetical protein
MVPVLRGKPRPRSSGSPEGGRVTARPTWTEADAAELDVLLHALTAGYFEHREQCVACNPAPCPQWETWQAHLRECRACQGDAPLTFGPPCERRSAFLTEHSDCPRCSPCPGLRAAIREVCDWRGARALLSRAEAFRAAEDEVSA